MGYGCGNPALCSERKTKPALSAKDRAPVCVVRDRKTKAWATSQLSPLKPGLVDPFSGGEALLRLTSRNPTTPRSPTRHRSLLHGQARIGYISIMILTIVNVMWYS